MMEDQTVPVLTTVYLLQFTPLTLAGKNISSLLQVCLPSQSQVTHEEFCNFTVQVRASAAVGNNYGKMKTPTHSFMRTNAYNNVMQHGHGIKANDP